MTIGASSPPSVSPSRGARTLRAPGPRDFSGPATPVPGRAVPCEATAPPCGGVRLAGGAPAFCCGSTMPSPADGAAATAAGDGAPGRSAAPAPGVRPESGAWEVLASAPARAGSDVPRDADVPPWRVVSPLLTLGDRSARFAASPETSPPITLPGMLGDADRESTVCRGADVVVGGSACGLGAAGGALGGGGASTSRAGAVSTVLPPAASAGGGVRPALVARPSSAGGPTGVSRAVFSDGSRPVGGAGAGAGARAAMSDVGGANAGVCRLGGGSETGGRAGAAAGAGFGVDGFGVATVATCGSGAADTGGKAETGGKLVGATGVSLGGSGGRTTVSAGGVGVGSGARATGGDGGISDGLEDAEGAAGSGVVACSGGRVAATNGFT